MAKFTLRCEVAKVEKRQEYNYSTGKRDEHVNSELRILENDHKITGSIYLNQELTFGNLYQIVVDLDNPLKVVTQE